MIDYRSMILIVFTALVAMILTLTSGVLIARAHLDGSIESEPGGMAAPPLVADFLTMNPNSALNVGAITRKLDTGGGRWNLWQTSDVIEPTGPNYAAILTDALNTPLGDGSYDHTYATCWNPGRTIATQPQSCRGDIESHWGSNSEMYDTFTGNDNKEHRWIGTTAAWDGTIGSTFIAGSVITFGDWSAPPNGTVTIANATATPGSMIIGASGMGMDVAIESTSTATTEFEVGTPTNPGEYMEVGASGVFASSATTTTPLSASCVLAGDCSFTITNSANESGTLTARSTGNVDVTATSGNVRLDGARQQAASFFDVLDAFGNRSLTGDGTTGTWTLDHIAGETDVSLACNGAGGATTCLSNSCNNNGGTFQTTGTGATSCTVTFAGPPSGGHAPSCTVGIQSTAAIHVGSETAAVLTIVGSAIAASTPLDYTCWFH